MAGELQPVDKKMARLRSRVARRLQFEKVGKALLKESAQRVGGNRFARRQGHCADRMRPPRVCAHAQPRGVFALSAPNPKPRVGCAAHGAVASAPGRRASLAWRAKVFSPQKNEKERQKARRDEKMSGGPQRIPKGFAQKVGAAEPKPGFTLA